MSAGSRSLDAEQALAAFRTCHAAQVIHRTPGVDQTAEER
jgi:hypothetical protein